MNRIFPAVLAVIFWSGLSWGADATGVNPFGTAAPAKTAPAAPPAPASAAPTLAPAPVPAAPALAPAPAPAAPTLVAPAFEAPAAPAPSAAPKPAEPKAAAPTPKTAPAPGTLLEETSPPVAGDIISVPVPKISREIYINAGTFHGAKIGDYFLAYNAAVAAAALLRVEGVQDRMSNVTIVAQLAALQVGDRVKRVTEHSAALLKKNMEQVVGLAPPLGTGVVVDEEMLRISRSVGTFPVGGEGAPVPAGGMGAPVPAGGMAPPVRTKAAPPDLSDVMLLAKGTAKGINISWTSPAAGTPSGGYTIYRTTNSSQRGAALNPQPVSGMAYDDMAVQDGVTYVYRLAGIAADGTPSVQLPSLEAAWNAAQGGVKARSLSPFSGAAAPAASTAAPVPVAAAASRPAAPPAPAPVPAAPPIAGAPKPAATPPALAPAPVPAAPPAAGASKPAAPPAPAPVPTAPPIAGAPKPAAPPVPVPAPVPAVPPLAAAPKPAATPPALAPAPVPSAPPVAAPAPAPAATPPTAPPTADTAAPAAPEKVSVSIEGSTVVIRWNPVSSKTSIDGYIVYRSYPGDETGAPLNSSPTEDSVYKDRAAKEGSTYVYWVCTQAADGKLSNPSSKQKVEIPKSSAVPFF